MAEETSVADAAAGVEEANPSMPETSETTQVAQEPQSAATPQVEGVDNKPQVTEPPRYEGLFRSERKRIRKLEETINQISQKNEELISYFKKDTGVPQSKKFDPAAFFNDPESILTEREQRVLSEITALRSEITNLKEGGKLEEHNRKSLGALEKLYPKSSPDSNESLEERVQKDPEYSERLQEFFSSPAMKAMSLADPDGAVEYAIWKLGIKPPTSPTVIKKSAMGGTGSGNPGMGGKVAASESDLRSELKKLSDQADKNPELRMDEKFKKRKGDVMQNLERLLTRKTG